MILTDCRLKVKRLKYHYKAKGCVLYTAFVANGGLAVISNTNLKGTFNVTDGVANISVEMFEGSLGDGKGPLKALGALIGTAKSAGATEININASFANEKLMNLMAKIGELTSEGGEETIRIVFD